MSAIFPYVGFNYSSSAPCLGGLLILRSLENCTGTGTGTTNRQDLLKEQDNSNVAGVVVDPTDCRPDKQAVTKASLEASAEAAQAKNEHNAGMQRLISRIRNNLGRASVAVALGLALSLSSCAFDALSKRGSNTELSQTQGVVEPYFGNGESGAYVPFWATDVPREVNGKGFLYPDLATTPPPTELGN